MAALTAPPSSDRNHRQQIVHGLILDCLPAWEMESIAAGLQPITNCVCNILLQGNVALES
jgi:hypothetical protein